MRKSSALAVVLGVAAPVIAGLVDHGDYTGFPNVNVDAHLVKIGKAHFPDIANIRPGLGRTEAWRHDIAEAAKGLNIPADELERFANHVIRYYTTAPVAAPHERLLEFELYARGRNELFFHNSTETMPPAWGRLFALPVEKRRYTTIPVLYVWNKFCSFRNARRTFDGDAAEAIAAARMLGCFDTQGCELALLGEEPEQVYSRRNFRAKLEEYHWLFRAYCLKRPPVKKWRRTNAMDVFSWADGRGDRFFSGSEMPALRYNLYRENAETLRELCRISPALRDLIVAIGLTNRQMEDARKVALEFAPQSRINYPVRALRLPLAEAEKLRGESSDPELAKVLDQQKIKALNGMAKVDAIDAYIAKYPDYTPKDMPVTSIALNTHGELQALAGLELFKLGRYREALERWIVCGTPEDIGLVAEQIFTVDELAEFCSKLELDGIDECFAVDSIQCARNNKLLYPNFVGRNEAAFVLRNILARRLMRERRFDEAQKWFTGMRERYCVERFTALRAVALDPTSSPEDKLAATLSLAALIRFRGDMLYGTFLEPDNVICGGEYPCEWGTRLTGVKLNKPDLPRFHYRWIAAEFYSRAAEYTDDPKLKGFCFWMAGTLLKNRDPKLADRDFKALFAVRPELTENNWFKPLSKCGAEVKELYERRFFALSPRVTAAIVKLPEMKEVELPPNDGSAKALFDTGVKLVSGASGKGRDGAAFERLHAALYAYFLAGEKGMAGGYYQCGLLCGYLYYEDDIFDIAFFRKALETDPNFAAAKLMLGKAYLYSGQWAQGLTLVRHVADNERSNRRLESLAAFNIGKIYTEGLYGVAPDEALAKRYLDQAEKLDPDLVGLYRVELAEKARAAEEKRKAEEKKAKPEAPKPARQPGMQQ